MARTFGTHFVDCTSVSDASMPRMTIGRMDISDKDKWSQRMYTEQTQQDGYYFNLRIEDVCILLDSEQLPQFLVHLSTVIHEALEE